MSSATGRRATSSDVARLSKVSRATVSFVLNQTPGQTISESTRQRVLEAAQALGYVPNHSAKALASGRSDIVVIDLSGLPHGNPLAEGARALSAALQQQGFTPIVDPLLQGVADHSLLLTLAQKVQPAAVVTLTPLPQDIQELLGQAGVTTLVSALPATSQPEDVVVRQAGPQVRHLLDLGHRRLAYAVPAGAAREPMVLARQRAVQRCASQAGAHVDLVLECAPYTPPEQVLEIVRQDVTAVAAFNDEVALAVLGAARRAGVVVPEDLSVMGVDDIPLGLTSVPTLTTIRNVWDAELAAVRIAASIRSQQPPPQTELSEGQVIQRESTAPAPEHREHR